MDSLRLSSERRLPIKALADIISNDSIAAFVKFATKRRKKPGTLNKILPVVVVLRPTGNQKISPLPAL